MDVPCPGIPDEGSWKGFYRNWINSLTIKIMSGNNQQVPVSPVVSIPGYKIVEVLGKGGMAIVYLAVQESIGRKVALKILAPDHHDETFTDRFLREARIVSHLTHPNIITVYDAGVQQGTHYMSMEYIPGKNLTQARDVLSRKQKIDIIKQIALALEYAGKKGYVHRDIKPENIMLHEDGRAILTDFGIARGQEAARGLTLTGKAIGTPYFMSPEQTKGLTVDHRSDIYSLGVVLYQSIAGHVPFDGPSIVAIGIKHISEPIPTLPPGMELFQPIINKCMSKEPEHRYQSASELYTALESIPEAQLDYIDAKAKALKNSPVMHHSHTLPNQPSVEILPNTAANSTPSQSLPKIKAQRVSAPVNITETAEFKRLNRRRRGWVFLLLVLAVAAVGYYQQAFLLNLWQENIQPLVVQYLPGNVPPAQTTSKPSAQSAPVTNPAQPGGTGTPAAAPTDVTATETPQATDHKEKSLAEVSADIQLFKDKLRINPDDTESREGIEQSRLWFKQKLQTSLAHKDVDSARQILRAYQRDFPRAAASPAFPRIEQRIRQIEQFNSHVQKARVYLAANAVAKPAGANAMEEYLAASRIDPEDPTVHSGLQQIARHFFDKAKTAQSENKLTEAVQFVASGLQADAADPQLLALKLELESGIKQEQQLARQLQQADEMMRQDQVLEPASSNAYQLYREVLRADPDNAKALEGLQQVQLWLNSKIQALYDKQQYLPARNLLKQAQALFPGSTQFLKLQHKVEQGIDATYPKITSIEFAATPITALSGHSRLDKLAPGQTLYAGFAFKNFYQANTQLIARLKDGSGQQLYDETAVNVGGGKGAGYFALQLPKPGSRDGNYSVELYLKDVRMLKARLSGLH
jgi:serine/threonine-protein kinase PpkA